MDAENVCVVDSFTFGGPVEVPATVSFSLEWEASGPTQSHGRGRAVPPTDPAAFLGEFAPARLRGSFSGRELGFSFKSRPGVSAERGYAEVGRERNGIFLL